MKKAILILMVLGLIMLSGCGGTKYVCPDGSTVSDTSFCPKQNQQTSPSEQKTVCNSPYMQIGSQCCLDNNGNGVCDTDENYSPIQAKLDVDFNPTSIRQGDIFNENVYFENLIGDYITINNMKIEYYQDGNFHSEENINSGQLITTKISPHDKIKIYEYSHSWSTKGQINWKKKYIVYTDRGEFSSTIDIFNSERSEL